MRRLAAELVGTGLLVAVVIGSGIAAVRLSPHDVGLQLLENSLATAFGLAVLITMLAPLSGAHLNPVVSFADWWLGRGAGGLTLSEAGQYSIAQVLGAILGAVLANTMFGVGTAVPTTGRNGGGLMLGEVVATAGLVALVFALARTGRAALAAPAVGAWIGAAYWFTSSTSFANPAVTIGRVFTNTFAGIAPGSVVPFVAAQALGAVLGVAAAVVLYPADVHEQAPVPERTSEALTSGIQA
ncbi:Aquaporin Z [Cellulomonas sp. T2.31MG-18]